MTARARPRPPALPRPPKTFTWSDTVRDPGELPMLSDSQVIPLPTRPRGALGRPSERRRIPLLGLFLSSALAAFLAVVGLSAVPSSTWADGITWVRESLAAAAPASQNPPAPTYVVRAGDSLSSIAARQLGDAGRWPEIYAANRDRLRSPAEIEVGTALRLPGS